MSNCSCCISIKEALLLATPTTAAVMTMRFEFGLGKSKHSIEILPHSQVVILTHDSITQLNGLYTPVPLTQWPGGWYKSFNDLTKYIGADGRKPRLQTLFDAHGPSRQIYICFHKPTTNDLAGMVPFVKVYDRYITDGLRWAQRRIRDNPRRLALAMALHPRLGKESPLRGGGEDVLRMIVAALLIC